MAHLLREIVPIVLTFIDVGRGSFHAVAFSLAPTRMTSKTSASCSMMAT